MKVFSYSELYESNINNIVIGISITTIMNQKSINIIINNIYDFIKTYGFTLNIISTPTTLDIDKWLSDNNIKYDNIIIVDKKDIWKNVDILIEDDSFIINSKPLSKICIKVTKTGNDTILNDINIPNISALTINVIKNAISNINKKIIS